MPDIFHTFFGLAGLSLLGDSRLEPIDPVYALPIATLRRMGISSLYSVHELPEEAAAASAEQGAETLATPPPVSAAPEPEPEPQPEPEPEPEPPAQVEV